MFFIETIDCLTKAAYKYASQIKENSMQIINALNAFAAAGQNSSSQGSIQMLNSKNANLGSNNNNNNNNNNCNSSSNSNSNNNNNCPAFEPGSDTLQKLIINTNNIEKVRESLKIVLNELDFNNYQSIAEKMDKLKLFETNKAQLETSISNASEYMVFIVEYIIENIITTKVL